MIDRIAFRDPKYIFKLLSRFEHLQLNIIERIIDKFNQNVHDPLRFNFFTDLRKWRIFLFFSEQMCAPGYARKHQICFLLGQGNITSDNRIQK